MKKILIFHLLFIVNSLIAQTKTDTFYHNDVKMFVGKTISDSEMNSFDSYQDSINNTHIGEQYIHFNLTTLSNRQINNKTILGKVNLFAFWYPSCSCFDLNVLQQLSDKFKKDSLFQITVITFEKDLTIDLLKKNNFDIQFAFVRWESDCKEMNYYNGFFSFLVIDKEGEVAILNGGRKAEQFITSQSFSNRLNELIHQ